MKKTEHPIIESFITLALLIIMVLGLSRLVERKDSFAKYDDFYRYADEYDVLFFGCSHMMNANLPMELWKEYGIRSYNMGNGAETIPVTYHVIRNALDHSSPKLIIVDPYYALADTAFPPKVGFDKSHMFFDTVPMSTHKADFAYDLLPDSRNRWNYLFDFTLYHSRWNDLTILDLFPENDHFGGSGALFHSYTPKDPVEDPFPALSYPELHGMPPMPKAYFKKIKELCDERGIRIVCILNPYAQWYESANGNLDYEKELAELGIEFINLRDTDIADIFADSADNMHLNISGQRKVNAFYGNYISKAGIISSASFDSEAVWNERYSAYIQKKADLILACTDCAAMLTDLNDPDFTFDIRLKNDAPVTDTMNRMLNNAADYDNVSILTDDTLASDIIINVCFKGSREPFVSRSFDL